MASSSTAQRAAALLRGRSLLNSAPSLAEVRAVCQPDSVLGRRNAEHWAGRLYLRRISVHLTRALLPTGVSANGVTWMMIGSGVAGAAGLATLPGLAGPLAAVAGTQAQMLLDCSDGEVARWRGTSSPAGIYLDRVGHYLTEAALPVALGIRADGGLTSLGGWTTVGAGLSVLWLLTKAETDLVHVARALSGRPPVADTAAASAPGAGALSRVRRALRVVPFFRFFVAIEFSLLAFGAGLADGVLRGTTNGTTDGAAGTRGLLVLLVPVGIVTAGGHLVGVLASERLR